MFNLNVSLKSWRYDACMEEENYNSVFVHLNYLANLNNRPYIEFLRRKQYIKCFVRRDGK